jgi:hypothetical protein
LGSDDQTVLAALHACNATGRTGLQQPSARAHHTRLVFAPEQAERLRALLQPTFRTPEHAFLAIFSDRDKSRLFLA